MSGPILLILRVLMALVLYVFLGWSLLTLWKEMRVHGVTLSERKIPEINLSIKTEDQPVRNLDFARSELYIGRDPSCDCSLQDESVSVRHSRLKYHHGQWWIEDLGSKNGTLLNARALSSPTVVVSGDEITCGNSLLTVQISPETAQK